MNLAWYFKPGWGKRLGAAVALAIVAFVLSVCLAH